jgi:hypothetical protein
MYVHFEESRNRKPPSGVNGCDAGWQFVDVLVPIHWIRPFSRSSGVSGPKLPEAMSNT